MSTEKPKSSGLITLKSVVMNVKNDIADYTPAMYHRLLQFSIRGYAELCRLGLSHTVERQWLTLTDINTVTLPPDYVSFVAIGIPYLGKLWTFTEYKMLIPPLSEEDGAPALDDDRGEDVAITDGGDVSGYPVTGGRNATYYMLDEEHNRIVINGCDETEVLLYYVSTGLLMNGETYVPRKAEEALIAFVHWKMIQHDRKANNYDKEAARRDYETEYAKLKHLQASSLEDIYDAIAQTWKQSIKR